MIKFLRKKNWRKINLIKIDKNFWKFEEKKIEKKFEKKFVKIIFQFFSKIMEIYKTSIS